MVFPELGTVIDEPSLAVTVSEVEPLVVPVVVRLVWDVPVWKANGMLTPVRVTELPGVCRSDEVSLYVN
jgi:hypothetical protein